MITLHANILERNGRKAFVVLPYEEFVQIQEELEDFDDLRALRAAKAQEATALVGRVSLGTGRLVSKDDLFIAQADDLSACDGLLSALLSN